MDDGDRQQALSIYQQILDAWNRRNASDFAALFAQDGNAVGFDGSVMNGRAEIASTLSGIFTSHETAAYVSMVREIRALGPGVVLVRSVAGMVPPGAQELNPAVNAIQSVVVVSSGGEWKIALLHNTPAAFHGRPDLASQLTGELTSVLRSGRTVVSC